MLTLEGINFLAILVAWIINCAVGAYWYSLAGFVQKWKEYTGIDIMEIPQNEATKTLMWVVFSGLIQAIALGLILNSLHVNELTHGLLVGLVLWAGFVAGTTVGTTLYSRRSWKFWWLNASYFLIVMSINSIILSIWR